MTGLVGSSKWDLDGWWKSGVEIWDFGFLDK